MMKPTINNAKVLIENYLVGNCPEEDKILLEQWYNQLPLRNFDLSESDLEKDLGDIWRKINQTKKQKSRKLWPKLAVAVSIFMVICASAVFLFYNNKNQVPPPNKLVNDVAPGGNKAILTLSDGRKIILNDVAKGKLAQLTGVTISKATEGQLVYTNIDHQNNTKIVTYNTLQIPRGGQYQLILPDGSKVWLNAATTLKYPSSFRFTSERKVELEGEAYFEIAHNASKPFFVLTNNQTVKVLGTHFNVSAYDNDETSKTTLFEGKVLVETADKEITLKPNQQATFKKGYLMVANINNENDLAWKNNEFIFRKESLENILKKMERWYDVRFICPKEIKHLEFGGYISRKKTLKNALDLINQEGTISFKIEGRIVTVEK